MTKYEKQLNILDKNNPSYTTSAERLSIMIEYEKRYIKKYKEDNKRLENRLKKNDRKRKRCFLFLLIKYVKKTNE